MLLYKQKKFSVKPTSFISGFSFCFVLVLLKRKLHPSSPATRMAKLTPFFFLSFLIISSSLAFQSDEFGLEGAQQQTPTTRKRYSDPDSDSKVQFSLEHAFGDSDFSPAGTFSARLKSWSHGGKVLSLPFSFPNPIE